MSVSVQILHLILRYSDYKGFFFSVGALKASLKKAHK